MRGDRRRTGKTALLVLGKADTGNYGVRKMKAVFGPYTVSIGKSLTPSRALITNRYWHKGYTANHILTNHGAVIDVLMGGNVIGTVLVTLDSPKGLSADEAYADELNSIRGHGCKLAELSRFAILPGQTTRSVIAAMFHFVYFYTYLLNDVTDLVCEVIPRHAAAQKRLLGFQHVAGPKRCNRVGAEAAVLLHRKLEWL